MSKVVKLKTKKKSGVAGTQTGRVKRKTASEDSMNVVREVVKEVLEKRKQRAIELRPPSTEQELFSKISELINDEMIRPNDWGAELACRCASSVVTYLIANRLVVFKHEH